MNFPNQPMNSGKARFSCHEFLFAGFAIIATAAWLSGCAHRAPRIVYPVTQSTNQADVYHDISVADPYRWLEDDKSAETKKWVEAQNQVTFGYLKEISSRDAIQQRLTKLWNYERFTVPYRRGGRYFFSRNDGLQNQNVLYTM